MKLLYLPVSMLLLNIIACNNPGNKKQDLPDSTPAASYKKLNQVLWLLGIWQDSPKIKNPAEVERTFTEIWRKADDSTWNGESFVISHKDTVFYESIKLQERDAHLYYIVSVKDQNKEAPVSFKLISLDSMQLVFENPTHDFPSKITYTKIGSDSLYAEISGMAKGQERKVGFPFKKITR